MPGPAVEKPDRAAPLPNLTALRFFAALMVLGFHYTLNTGLVEPRSVEAPFFTQGFLGVPLFFVLSGFVLAYSHTTVASKSKFYVARFARVYPMYFFALLLLFPFALKLTHEAGEILEPQSIPATLLLAQAWFPKVLFFANPPAWTLSVEAFFYLLFPFLLPFVVRRSRSWVLWMLLLWAVFLVQPVLATCPALADAVGIHHAARWWLLYFCGSPPVFLGEFVMGMFAGASFRQRPQVFTDVQALGAVLLCVVTIYFSAHLPYMVVRNSGVAPSFTLLVYVFAGWRSEILASKPLQFAGEISYSIYLLQYWVREVNHHMPLWMQHTRILIPMLFGAASLSYLYVEKPARNAILRFSHIRSGPKPLPTPLTMP